MNVVTEEKALTQVKSELINQVSDCCPMSREDLRFNLAIASSGLGYVTRGNESWALTVAEALHRSGMPLTLLGSKANLATKCPYQAITNWRREQPLTRRFLKWHYRYLL